MGSHKHFQLVVPNYDHRGQGSRDDASPLSYLRLGASCDLGDEDEPLASPTRRGDDLVWNHDDSGQPTSKLAFKDDWRHPTLPDKRYVFDDGATRQEVDRVTQTEALLTRGGWREHTDGNKISTTRGDCVEVVQGNYKLIVLGRIAASWDPSGLGSAASYGAGLGRTRQEVSGGHYNESTSTPGEVLSITWSPQEDGTWTTLEQTDHGDVKSTFRGWMHEEYYGPEIISTVGCGVPELPIEVAGGPARPNGSSAGAHPAQQPTISEQIFARSIDVEERIGTLDETTTVLPGYVQDALHVNKSSIQRQTASILTETTVAAATTEHLLCGMKVERDEFEATRTNVVIGGLDLSLGVTAGVDVALTKGTKLTAKLASSFSINATGYAASINALLWDLKLRVGPVIDLKFSESVDVKLFESKTDLTKIFCRTKKNADAATDLKTNGQDTELAALNSEGSPPTELTDLPAVDEELALIPEVPV